MRWKKVMKDHLIAKTRSTSDLPTSNNGKKKTNYHLLIWNNCVLRNYKYFTIAFSCHCTFYIFAGNLNERIGARLHDLSQLQLESGKRSHLSRANISKSSRLVSALKEKQKLIENNVCVQLQ